MAERTKRSSDLTTIKQTMGINGQLIDAFLCVGVQIIHTCPGNIHYHSRIISGQLMQLLLIQGRDPATLGPFHQLFQCVPRLGPCF